MLPSLPSRHTVSARPSQGVVGGWLRSAAVAVALLCLPVVAGATPVITPAELVEGEPGRCVTEMDGGVLVEIPVTVLGVVGGTTPEGEIVLIRLHGERFDHVGIIAGMSGSPVYVRDRLLGALAFGWAFAKDPIAGVTPFSRMETLAVAGGAAAPTAGSARPSLAALVAAVRAGGVGPLVLSWLFPATEPGSATRLHLPVAASGGRPGAWLGQAWDRLGWVDTPAAAGGATVEETRPLVPGAAVCGVLVEGDATLSVGGTVTEVRDDQVWAFGHPFLGGDALRLPMARGRVVAVLPSLYSSFKFISPTATVGAFEVDRSHGVWGRLGPAPALVPVAVRVAEHTYTYRVLHHPVLLPYLVGYVAAASHGARGRAFGEETVRLAVEVDYPGRTARLAEVFAGPGAAAEAAGYAAAVVAFLESGVFAPPAIVAVRVALDPTAVVERATVVDVVAERRVVSPGETLGVRARMRRQGGADEVRRLEVRVPTWLPDGRLDLVVADGAAWSGYDLDMRPPAPDSFAAMVDLLGRLRPSSRLVAVLERKETGMTIPGGAVAAPPGVIVNLGSGLGGSLTAWAYRVVARVEVDLPFSLAGAARIPLTVRARTTGALMDDVR